MTITDATIEDCPTHGRDCEPPISFTYVEDGPFDSHAAAYLLCNDVPARIILNLLPGYDGLENEVRLTRKEARDLATTLLVLARDADPEPEPVRGVGILIRGVDDRPFVTCGQHDVVQVMPLVGTDQDQMDEAVRVRDLHADEPHGAKDEPTPEHGPALYVPGYCVCGELLHDVP